MRKNLTALLLLFFLLSLLVFATSCNGTTKDYSVNFETNGGVALNAQKISGSYTEAPTPEREGYLFDGWFLDSSFTAPIRFPFNVNSDITLYAKWLKLYSVNFVVDDGNVIKTQKVLNTLENSPTPERDGYFFAGWFLDSTYKTPLTLPLPINSDTTIYAKWQKIHTVNFISNGGSSVDAQRTVDVISKAPKTNKDGYFFGGWFSDPSLTAPVTFPFTVNSDTTLYAKWHKIYYVEFVTNGGTEVRIQKTIDFITNPPSTQRDGYVFEGWYLDAALTAPASFPLSVNRDTTLYAKWRELYTVSFYTNGGSYVSPLTLQNAILSKPPVEPTQNGYLFDGWYLDSSLTTPVTFPLSVNRDTTLYAKWLKLTDQTTYQDCAIKLDSDYHSSLIYTITPRGFDLEKLNLEGYHMKITVTYKVRYVKDYDVLWDIGYAGSPKYEIYLLDGSGVGQMYENMTTTTSQKTRTITLTRSAADLINDKITLKVSTNNIQNIIYFEDIVVTYECY